MQHTDADQQKYIDKAIAEALHPEFAVTKQYLEHNLLLLENGVPKVERLDMNLPNGLVAVFLTFQHGFFLEVHLTRLPDIAVDFVYVKSSNKVSFTATSAKLKYADLAKGLNLQPLTGWSRGDATANGGFNRMFSSVSFKLSISESYELEDQLKLLLTELEKDAVAVQKLGSSVDAYISVYRCQYVSGNAGIHLGAETINRLSKLNLSVDIDTIIVGQPISESDDEEVYNSF